MELVTERMRSSFLVLRDLVLCAGPLVGAIGGGGVGFLVWLCVHAAKVSSLLSLSLCHSYLLG